MLHEPGREQISYQVNFYEVFPCENQRGDLNALHSHRDIPVGGCVAGVLPARVRRQGIDLTSHAADTLQVVHRQLEHRNNTCGGGGEWVSGWIGG